MFGRGKGGLEQAFLDYNDMLKEHFEDTIAIYAQDAFVESFIKKQGIRSHSFSMWGDWDPFAVIKLRMFIFATEPDLIITHGNRALKLINKANKKNVPVMAVAHKYSAKHFKPNYTGVAITKDIKKYLENNNIKKTVLIPNMLKLDEDDKYLKVDFNNPPIIGALGRFVSDKGFEFFIKALGELKKQGVEFEAILAGQGPLEKSLKELTTKLGLDDLLHFPGWIEDKELFFKEIDILCIPSIHEPFGIVVLEGMKNSNPMVIANSEGPSEIVTNDYDALLVEKSDEKALADGLKNLILDQEKSKNLSANAYNSLKEKYEFKIVSNILKNAVEYAVM